MSHYHTHTDARRGLDYIGVCCVFVCYDGKGNILYGKRSDKCRDEQGRWDMGAGAVEFGETFEEAVRREVKEEYGTEPLEVEYISTKTVIRKHREAITHWVVSLHFVRVDPRRVHNGEPEKIDEIAWFPMDMPPEPLHSQASYDLDYVREYVKNKNNAAA